MLVGCGTARDAARPSQDVTLGVMAYNIHHAADASGKVDVDRIARVIRESGADIVALQEVDRNVERSGRRDLLAELAEATALQHRAFGKNLDFGGGDYGNALLSRFPIDEYGNEHLHQREPHEQRGVLRARLSVDGTPLFVFVIHLDHASERERLFGIDQLETMLAEIEHPAIIAGDLNDVPQSLAYERITSISLDAWATTGDGDGHTFPSTDPDRRIDYVFHTPELRPLRSWVPETEASDHRPVLVDFARW